jgi:16S rRNA (guanine527-N7)-methyltransferase
MADRVPAIGSPAGPAASTYQAAHDVPRETLDRLGIFVELALRWSQSVNLLAPNEAGQIWQRHVWDSWQLVPLIKPGISSALDIGSGAGFPGLVLSLGTGIPFLLAESDKRKAAFLREAIRATGASATVTIQRAETLDCQVELVTARAVAPLVKLLTWAHPLLAPGGMCLLPKGRSADAEIAAAQPAWRMTLRRVPSVTDPEASVLAVTHLAPR